MSSQYRLHVTGPNGELEPVCLFAIPAVADELISMEEWLKNATAFAQSDPPAPKPTEADDGFGMYSSTFPQGLSLTVIWALEMK